jgi:signal recognition particle receptor subunit beta
VIQYNKRDLPNCSPVEQLEAAINKDQVPCFESIATTGIGVFDSLRAISKLVIAHLSRQTAR